MVIRKAKVFIFLCLCLTLSIQLSGQETTKQDQNKSCKQFVETFYTWYLTISLSHNTVSASDRALKDRPYLFSSELLLRLREESEVQDRAGSDLVNLDIDPFAGPDGIGGRFDVGKISVKNDKCWAEIHFDEYKIPGVMPELAFKDGRWIFVNFYYPSPSNLEAANLLSELKSARESWKASGLLKDKKPNTQ